MVNFILQIQYKKKITKFTYATKNVKILVLKYDTI